MICRNWEIHTDHDEHYIIIIFTNFGLVKNSPKTHSKQINHIHIRSGYK